MKTTPAIPPSVLAAFLALASAPCSRAWSPGAYPTGSTGFSVDTSDRNDVVSFWNAVYQSSEGYWNRHGWTGNYSAPSPFDSGVGSTASVFVTDTERRVNFHRAMCGLPASVRLNTGSTIFVGSADSYAAAPGTTKSSAAQRSAYMLIRTWGYADATGVHPPLGSEWAALSHDPVQAECVAWTSEAWNASHYGNLAMGFYGPGAIDAYMAEFTGTYTSSWNTHVGHRRWILFPPSTDLATGDTPGAFDASTYQQRHPTNVLYVTQKPAERATVAARFTAFPPAGFIPACLNSWYWSLSYPGADFSTASVAVSTASGTPLAVSVLARNGNFGDPALVWQAPASAAVTSVTSDTSFDISVTGINGPGVPSSHSYRVTLINPARVTSDLSVFGASSPATAGATYQITPPSRAEAIAVNTFQSVSTAWTETAEDSPVASVIPSTTGTYAFRSSCSFASDPAFTRIAGLKSFRLTFPTVWDPRLNGTPEQSFEIDRDLVPGSGAKLNFKYLRGFMTAGSNLSVESSADQGVTWTRLGAAINGRGDQSRDSASADASRDLAPSAAPIRIRFRYHLTPGQGAYTDELLPTYPTGIFIDTISTANCQWLEPKKTNELAGTASSFVLNATTAGVTPAAGTALKLRMRAKLGNRWMPYGPAKSVAFSASAQTSAPVIAPAGGELVPGTAVSITGAAGSTIRYRLNGGEEISSPSPVAGISMPPYPQSLSVVACADASGRSSSPIVAASFTTSPFKTWFAGYYPGVTDPTVISPAADPDHDGEPNILEFALGGDPSRPGTRSRLHVSHGGNPASPRLTLTIAVRSGTPAFVGYPSPSATADGLTYIILGGSTPGTLDGIVSEVPPETAALPEPPAGCSYRTFTLTDTGTRGFMRVKVSTAQ